MNIFPDNSTHENVLLLVMSTLPRRLEKNDYYYYYPESGENWTFYGKGQLAADAKAIFSILEANNAVLNRIVIIATEQTRKVEMREDIGEHSAVSLFKKEVEDYLNQIGEEDEHFVTGQTYNDEMFHVIDMNGEETLYEAVKAIKGSGGSGIELYIDVQGGLRSSSTQVNAITELLSAQNVTIKGRYANDYNPVKSGPYRIHRVDEEYETYDLVAAMTVFKKYGRGDELIKFFKAKENSAFATKLSRVIETAADSIQLCDVDKFDEAIGQISKLNEVYQKDKAGISPYLRIVYDDIWDDYSSLIECKYRYVEQIRWCLRKNYVQQALTIFESKMPDEYVTHGLCYMATKAQKDDVIKKLDELYTVYYLKDNYNKKRRYIFKNVNHYFINTFRNFDTGKADINIRYADKSIEEDIKANLEKYDYIKRERNKVNHANSIIDNDGFFQHMKNKYKNDNTWKSEERKDIKELLADFLDEWVALAEQVPEDVVNNVADLR